MNTFLICMLSVLVCTAQALTEAEFEALYKRTDKDAEACYQLYQAYRDGDGVEKNETCARKWLLGAHRNGMPVYNEIAKLPWRKKAKLKPGRQLTPRFSEETIQKKSEELKQLVEGEHPELLKIVNIDLTKISPKERAKAISETEYKQSRKLLSEGADPNAQNKGGGSIVSRFMERGTNYEKYARLFLEAGADLHAQDSSAIAAALKYTGPSSDSKLTAQGKKNRQKAEKIQAAKVEYLLKNGMDVNMYDTSGATMLCIACMGGSPATIEALCKAGADPNQKCSKYEIAYPIKTVTYRNTLIGIIDGNTPLLYCITGSNIQLIQTLLRCGADPEQPNDKGLTPITYAKQLLNKETRPEYRAKIEKVIKLLEEAIAHKQTPDTTKLKIEKKKMK
ncbi:MAG: hypothetical protein IKZ13_01475 [Akkermansia sp.]|nr:hypothetical protein [Akkermansia sp.]